MTGGLSGIGAAVVERFVADGMRVVAADVTAAPSTLGDGADSQPYHVDVADARSVHALVEAVTQAYGRIDCLVHCAGIARVAPFLDTPLQTFDQVVRTNVHGTFLVCQATARSMLETGGGSIVNVGSVSGLRGNVGRTAYGASKGAVVTMSEVMAVELADHGIRVNVIAPGPIETPLTAAEHDAATRGQWEQAVPMRRYGRPEDVASAAAYLCSDEANYVTGSVFVVDGGFHGAGILPPRP